VLEEKAGISNHGDSSLALTVELSRGVMVPKRSGSMDAKGETRVTFSWYAKSLSRYTQVFH